MLPLLPEAGRRSFGFVLPLFALGGVERVVLRQAAALRERGWRPHLFVLGEQRIGLSAAARECFESVNLLFGMGETDSDWKRRNSQAPPLDGRVELPKQQVTENRWTASD